MPNKYNCGLQEKFEAAKMFLTDLYKENEKLATLNIYKPKNTPKIVLQKLKVFNESSNILEKNTGIILDRVEECRKANNVSHCEFCEKNCNSR